MNRRLFVAAVAAGGLGATAGCLDDLEAYLEDHVEEIATFAASPAIVNESAAEDAGYEYQGTVETVHEEEVGGRSVEATSYASEYVRTIDVPLDVLDGEAATGIFGVVTSPQVSAGGEEFNPIGDMSHADIAEYVQDEYDDLDVDDESRRRRTVDALEQSVTVHTFEGEATVQGSTGVDVLVDVAQPEYGEDHVVIVAVYPDDEELDWESEEERVDVMMAGLEHGEDVDAEIRGADGDDEGDNDDSDDAATE